MVVLWVLMAANCFDEGKTKLICPKGLMASSSGDGGVKSDGFCPKGGNNS